METSHQKHVPWFLWPFYAIWKLLTWILGLTGRLVIAILGGTLLIVGAILTILIISAPIGIPLAIIGFLLVIRSIF
jgi:hypothetical protein